MHQTFSPENAEFIDLLQTNIFADYASRPSLLRERFSETPKKIIIDEVQKLPALLDEVHWLIENRGISFLLTGSSARKLKRGRSNLLGGRAWHRELHPLSLFEIGNWDLNRVINNGLIPSHYLSDHPAEELRAYAADYLKEEIADEALSRNVPGFSEFLRIAAINSSELLNHTNIARDCGVSAKSVRNYFSILEDTMLGYRLLPWKKSRTRRMIQTEKFYLFDTGVTNFLSHRVPSPGTPEFGKSFEQLVLMELIAYRACRQPDMEIRFWRTSTGQEVDFVLNDQETAIEVKAGRVHDSDCRHLFALSEDAATRKKIIVTLEEHPRSLNGVDVLPLKDFVDRLWSGAIV